MNNKIIEQLKGGLIVSCQALEDEPLHSSHIMARMAYAAWEGGAVGIRGNTIKDIRAIRKNVNLPVIGIVKKEYPASDVYITPTVKEVEALVRCGVDIVATDCTRRERPAGRTLADFFAEVRSLYPEQLFMADCSDYEEGLMAADLGFDLIGTTLRGYTEDTRQIDIPDLKLVEKLSEDTKKPVIAEGGIWTPKQLRAVFSSGAFAAVVGTAITRPREITRRFIEESGCRKK